MRYPLSSLRLPFFALAVILAGCASHPPPPTASSSSPSSDQPQTVNPKPQTSSSSPVTLTALTVDHLVNPTGLGDPTPRFSWKLLSDRPGEVQTAYQIRAYNRDSLAANSTTPLWDSGPITSDQSVLVPWAGPALASRAGVVWQVRVWDKNNQPTAWSNSATFELGLLNPATDWHAQWITSNQPRYDILQSPLADASWIGPGALANQAAAVRTTITLPPNAAVLSATLDAAADGLVTLYVNGAPIRQGPSSHTAPFHADFPTQLVPGPNLIVLAAAPVRGAGRNGAPLGPNNLVAHGVIILDNGRTLAFDTGPGWSAALVPVPPTPPPAPVAAPPAPTPIPDWALPTSSSSQLQTVNSKPQASASPSTTSAPSVSSVPSSSPSAPGSSASTSSSQPQTSSWSPATVLGPYAANPSTGSSDSTVGPARYLRKNFTVRTNSPVVKARLYSTALGTYQASLNGAPVNDHQLDPGWTDYFHRVMVQTTDVTALVHPGPNTLGAILADGWFAGRLGWMGLFQYKQISSVPLFAAQLEITYADGSVDTIATDASWQAGPGEILGSDQQLGETWDARAAVPNWNEPSVASATDGSPAATSTQDGSPAEALAKEGTPTTNSSSSASTSSSQPQTVNRKPQTPSWSPATVVPNIPTPVVPQVGPPVRTLLTLAPKKITRLGGTWIVDLGQNMVGHVRLSATGPANTTILIQHGEMLNADGTVYTENLRPAISVDQFTLAGTGAPEVFEPLFTFHGFRYVQITGYPGNLTADNIRGIVVGSDDPPTGTFTSSSADLNQLFSNIVWGQRGNFLSVPTDCPQRDERMGWMGDAQVFAPTAARDADVAAFFTKWLIDVDDGQSPRGDFSDVSPRVARPNPAMPVWGDAGVIIPWTMYQAYGDPAFLAANYDHMAAWVAYLQSISTDNIVSAISVGDHLAPVATPVPIMDTAYYAHSAQILAKAAAILGKTDDAAKYTQLYHDIAAAFVTHFVGPDGSITAPTPRGRGFGRTTPVTASNAPAPTTGSPTTPSSSQPQTVNNKPETSASPSTASSSSALGSPLSASSATPQSNSGNPTTPSSSQPQTVNNKPETNSPPRTGNTQAAYLVALAFNLLPDNLRPLVSQRLADNITQAGHLTTGFPGSGLLCPTLTQIGRSDLAWQLLFTDTYPSWLFSIRNGATTIWERWDGWTPERGFQASSMNSFNHYSFGAVGSWLYSGAAGILPDESAPGYKHFYLQPQFTARLTQLSATLDSPYGNITSAWHASGDQILYDCTIPPNTSATLTLPGSPPQNLPAGTYHFSFSVDSIK